MDLPTQSHLKTLRDALEFRLAELRAAVHAAELARRTPVDATEVGDWKDVALREQSDDIGEAEERRDFAEMQRVEAALHRLLVGRYGDCVDCGEPIGAQRLLVQPAAERCADCQARFEHRAGR